MSGHLLDLFGESFNDETRSAWHAAVKLETSLAEIAYHRALHLGEMVVPEFLSRRPDTERSEYDEWQADFHSAFHRLEPANAYEDCLQVEPVPLCYAIPKRLLGQRSNGILYPSVRDPGGTCLVCFRPPLIYNPRQAARYEIKLTLVGEDCNTKVRTVPIPV